MTDKPDLTRVWAVGAPSGNIVDPDTTTPGKFSAGWQAEVPPFEHFNFIQKLQTQGLAHINEQGIALWDIKTSYPIGGLAKGSDGNVYKALVSQSANDPITDGGTNWIDWEVSNRVIRVTSISAMEAYSAPVGYVFSLNAGGRSGTFDVIAGDFSTELAADTLNGIYVGLSDDPTALIKVAKRRYSQAPKLAWFGAAFDGTDESAIAIAMLLLTGELNIDKGQNLTAKGIEFSGNQRASIKGSLTLPSGSVDFDKIFFGYNCDNLDIFVADIDGNSSAQSGTLGTHLTYFIDCSNSNFDIRNAYDHYYVKGGSIGTTDGGNRDASTGAIFFNRATKVNLTVGRLDKWGREGIQIKAGEDCAATVGHCQSSGNAEYSGVQIQGTGNKLLRASVDGALASGIGFDTTSGEASNLLSTNTKENHGVNFGHPGFPASNSVVSNVVVDKAFLSGIQVSSSTRDLKISNFSVSNSGSGGLVSSDSSTNLMISNGTISNSGLYNVRSFASDIYISNVKSDVLDGITLSVTSASGLFSDGETITGPSGSATVRTATGNTDASSQTLFLTVVTGSFSASDAITGGSSGATATVDTSNTPIDISEVGGGEYITNPRLYPGVSGDQIRFADGTAIYTGGISVVVATGGSLTSETVAYTSNAIWSVPPNLTATIESVSSTGGYTVSQFRAVSTTSNVVINLNASVAQTYGISVQAIGRWK